MLSRIVATASLATALLLPSCATVTKMPLSGQGSPAVDKSKAIFLITATTRNIYKASYQPKLLVVNVERDVVNGSQDRLNFKMDDAGRTETDSPDQGNRYLIRLQLDPGTYAIQGLTCLNRGFLINAFFFAPLRESLQVSGPGVFYLGHVDAIVRERVDNEFRAGPVAPLMDQSVSGASGGTFDVTISDQWERDRTEFVAAFPALKAASIQKAILPAFDRVKAQRLWEEQ